MRQRTLELHREAERSGVVHDILHRRASGYAYALLLRNLLPAYAAMEHCIERRRLDPRLRPLAQRLLYRSEPIRADLRALQGSDWAGKLPLLPTAARYAARIALAARLEPALLVAHAYTRYLGDLSGGRLLRPLLAAAPGIGPGALAFTNFAIPDDGEGFRRRYREGLERAARLAPQPAALVSEAQRAFRLNIALGEEARRVAARAQLSLRSE
jgi:heme oxygenase